MMTDRLPIPTADVGVRLALQEVMDLVNRLEPTLTSHQCSLLHQLRLASESLGAARLSVRVCQR